MQRREFLQLPLAAVFRKLDQPCPLEGGAWYEAAAMGDSIALDIAPGTLTRAHWITADLLVDGNTLGVFSVTLHEGERRFRLNFGALNQCSLRLRLPLTLTDQNRWLSEREGAFLKPSVYGDRVDPARVDRLTFAVIKKAEAPLRFAMTPIQFVTAEPARLTRPLLPKGPLIDAMGQSRLHDWPGKSKSPEEVTARLEAQLKAAPQQRWPAEFSAWGGWSKRRLAEPAGFFRTYHDGRRWWLVDPAGFAFWSAGIDCVRVDCQNSTAGLEDAMAGKPVSQAAYSGNGVSFLASNLIRAFGEQDWRARWSQVALAELRRLRFNTVGNWSDTAWAAAARFPYVRPLSFRGRSAPMIYRDFPDVFHPGFAEDAAAYARQLESTVSDPALLGYFLMNEPTWGFSSELPAVGMLYTTETCATREALATFLRERNSSLPLDRVAKGRWTEPLPQTALPDLRAFSVVAVERYFKTLSQAAKAVDPNHLNLGMRWAGVPPEWAVEGMKTFDVYSLNCYEQKLPRDSSARIQKLLNRPVMVGEWHFGALDVGLPASGIGRLRDQGDRARAYRIYLEDAAANPDCVGVHWFTLYDQSALGRFDGENYNIGFLDICNRPYPELSAAAAISHERMYAVAAGQAPAFSDAPSHLPRLYL